MESSASQGIVVEGKNSVTLNNVSLTADNNTKNSDKSDYYQAVMIYQSIEVFPPKTEEGILTVEQATEKIAALSPDFMSVTYYF